MMWSRRRINLYQKKTVCSCLGTQFEGDLLGLGGEADVFAGFYLAQEPVVLQAALLLCFFDFVLGLPEIFGDFDKFLPKILDLLVLFAFYLIDRQSFLAVDAVNLNENLLHLIFLIIQLLFQFMKVRLKKFLPFAPIFGELGLQNLHLQFQGTGFLALDMMRPGIVIRFRGGLLHILFQISPHNLTLLHEVLILMGKFLITFLKILNLILQILEVAEALLVDARLLEVTGELFDVVLCAGEVGPGLLQYPPQLQNRGLMLPFIVTQLIYLLPHTRYFQLQG